MEQSDCPNATCNIRHVVDDKVWMEHDYRVKQRYHEGKAF